MADFPDYIGIIAEGYEKLGLLGEVLLSTLGT